MKKTLIVIMLLSVASSGIFACSYNENKHELTVCQKYKEDKATEKCEEAHKLYRDWVAKEYAGKAANILRKGRDKVFELAGKYLK